MIADMCTAVPLIVPADDHDRLRVLAQSSSAPEHSVLRARIVLLAAHGQSNTAIAEYLGVSRPTVIFWRARYRERGLTGLVDAPKSGRPRVVEQRSIISAMVNESPQMYGAGQWSSRLLAQHLQIGKTTVQAAWREYGIAPHGGDGFTFATVPAFTATIIAIVGLHLGPHANAVALAVAPRPCRGGWTPSTESAVSAEHLDHYRRYRTARMHADGPPEMESAVRHHDPGEGLAGFCVRLAHTLPGPPVHVVFDTEPPASVSARSELSKHPHVRIHHSPTPMAWFHLVDVSIALAEHHHSTSPH
ncbi:helix-turn-helix domain-containing protein [Rhodococcus erythropolis]|uniref:helix-turn-helix domain-containing protein n=1 Tax=Rhodococcus erythropolis TaxID=1833 RepID=UPI00294953C6|nr:helix-turn-helix domain-containing protein [Rhodococcus erythropolis]MDV6278059.1 helix-turn-helix domain-containing protein [Rhodococcus erythropolis]